MVALVLGTFNCHDVIQSPEFCPWSALDWCVVIARVVLDPAGFVPSVVEIDFLGPEDL